MVVYTLTEEWSVVRELGVGGFGRVFEVKSGLLSRALKVIPQVTSTWRDLLVNEVPEGPWAIPILEAGEQDGDGLLLMPLAEMSLRQRLGGSPVSTTEAISILADIAGGLAALESAGLVHRDIKPENLLKHEGRWKLSDFGEARYADATTGLSTHRLNLTPAYAAPERWMEERATVRTDVYSWGVIAYELLSGHRPFNGSREELRQQHLAEAPPQLEGIDATLAGLVKLTLAKHPETRPTAAELLRRLRALSTRNEQPGFRALAAAGAHIAESMAQESIVEAQRRQRESRHQGLFESAGLLLDDLAGQFKSLLFDNAMVATESDPGTSIFRLSLGSASLSISSPRQAPMDPWTDEVAPFEVVAFSEIFLEAFMRTSSSSRGRMHSLWFGDIQRQGEFEWYEVAFHASRDLNKSDVVGPIAIDLDSSVAAIFLDRQADVALARPFVPFTYESLESRAAEWAGWIAQAAVGPLRQPMLPESSSGGSWRRRGQERV